MRTLVVFDPGIVSGIAVFYDDILWDTYALEQREMYHYFEQRFPKLVTPQQTAVICESYIGRYLTTEAREVLKLIGMIEFATRQHLGTYPIYQRAQTRLSFLPQAKKLVRQLPVQRKWLAHHYDATSHGLAYLYYSRVNNAAFAPDPCLIQGEADDTETAREA